MDLVNSIIVRKRDLNAIIRLVLDAICVLCNVRHRPDINHHAIIRMPPGGFFRDSHGSTLSSLFRLVSSDLLLLTATLYGK